MPQHQPLRLEGHLGDLVPVPLIGPKLVEAADHGGGDDRRPAEPGADRKIRRNLEVEAVIRLDEPYDRKEQTKSAVVRERGERGRLERSSKIVRVDSHTVVSAPSQGRVRVLLDRRVHHRAAVLHEVVGQVRTAAREADSDRSARARQDLPLSLGREAVAREHIDETPVGIEGRDDVNALIQKLEHVFARRVRTGMHEIAIGERRYGRTDRRDSWRQTAPRMPPKSVPTTRPKTFEVCVVPII